LVVQTKNLSRRFGQRWAYARIDLELAQGDRLLLIGANGSGKTTLLRTLATLLPASQGELRLFGETEVAQQRGRIGFLSHSTGLYEDLSAEQNLLIFSKLFGRPLTSGEAKKRIEQLGLEYRHDPIRSYSAGMRKRAALAVLLTKEPELVLLDEPFSALDPQGIADLSELISSLTATVIITSHQVQQAAAISRRSVLLQNGQIRWEGAAAQAWTAWERQQDALKLGRG
jgi:heme exporter protein A